MTGLGIAALSPDKQGVWWLGEEKWQRIADIAPRNRLFGGAGGLLAEYPDGDVYLFNVHTNSFDRFGGPGADFAVTNTGVFGLTPQREAVWVRGTTPGFQWVQVGGPATTILAGQETVLVTDPQWGNLWELGPDSKEWVQIGGPGAAFAIGSSCVLGLNPTREAVLYYNVPPLHSTQWTTIGGPALDVFIDYHNFGYAISPDGQTIFRWDGVSWTDIGPAGAFDMTGAQFIGANGPVALTADRQAVWAWSTSGTTWVKIGGPADSIVAANLVPQQ